LRTPLHLVRNQTVGMLNQNAQAIGVVPIDFRNEVVMEATHVIVHSLGLKLFATMGFMGHRDEVPEQLLDFELLYALVLVGSRDRLYPHNELCKSVHCAYYITGFRAEGSSRIALAD